MLTTRDYKGLRNELILIKHRMDALYLSGLLDKDVHREIGGMSDQCSDALIALNEYLDGPAVDPVDAYYVRRDGDIETASDQRSER